MFDKKPHQMPSPRPYVPYVSRCQNCARTLTRRLYSPYEGKPADREVFLCIPCDLTGDEPLGRHVHG